MEPHPHPCCYHCVIVCPSPFLTLHSLPVFISLSFLGSTLCPQAPFQVPVYKPHSLCPGLACEPCLNKPFGVRWAALTTEGTGDSRGGVTGSARGGWSLARGCDGLGFRGRAGVQRGAQILGGVWVVGRKWGQGPNLPVPLLSVPKRSLPRGYSRALTSRGNNVRVQLLIPPAPCVMVGSEAKVLIQSTERPPSLPAPRLGLHGVGRKGDPGACHSLLPSLRWLNHSSRLCPQSSSRAISLGPHNLKKGSGASCTRYKGREMEAGARGACSRPSRIRIRICIQSLVTPSACYEASLPTSQGSLGKSWHLPGPQPPL